MSLDASPERSASEPGFRHEALLYQGPDEFVGATAPFIRDGIAAGEPVLVVVAGDKIDWLRDELGADAERVQFADMRKVGTNPARILPALRSFVATSRTAAGGVRGVGEPIWAGRRADELVECQIHESLLNLAFADDPDAWLLCPYDTAALEPSVIEEAHRSHPFLADGDGGGARNERFEGVETATDRLDEPLADPGSPLHELAFTSDSLRELRTFASSEARAMGLGFDRAEDVAVAVTELASNSVRHGGGDGRMLIWCDDETFYCEVRDRGVIRDPLAGRRRPEPTSESGRGLWLVNQLCDLVQVRTSVSGGSVVRLQMRRT